jgi:hypothetical protein
MRTGLGVAVLLALAPLAGGGCYGAFPLTHSVYDINGAVHLGIFKTIVFWIFAVTLYPLAMIADALVPNLIEFWTGVELPAASITDENGTHYAMQTTPDGRELTVTMSREGKETGTLRFVRVSATEMELRNADGALAGRMIRDGQGSIRLTDAQGKTMEVIDAQQVALLGATPAR